MGLACFWYLTLDRELVEQSLYLSPLSDARLETVLVDSLSTDPEKAGAIAETLFERNPRHLLAKATLSDVNVQKGDILSLEKYYFPLFKLTSKNEALVGPLVKISETNQEAFNIILEYIKRDKPNWGHLFLNEVLTTNTRDPSEFISLYSNYPAWLTFLYVRLDGIAGVESAYNAFLEIQNYKQDPEQLIIDPTFSKPELNWPFGWRFDKDVVSREEGAGVSLIYLGRGTPVLLEQLTKVGAGRFQVNLSMSGEASQGRGYYKLRVRCWKGQELLNLSIDDLSSGSGPIVADFEVLEGQCAFVELQVLGQAGRFPSPVRTWISSIAIKPKLELKP